MANGDGSDGRAKTDSSDSARLELLPLHSTDLLTVLDESGIVQYESPSIERLYGFGQDELVGEQVAEYFHPDDRERVVGAFERIVASETDRVETVEYRHRMADGSYRWIESVGSTNPTPEGNYVINSRDISVRKQRERELERTREQAITERDGKEAIRNLLLESSTGQEIADTTCRLLVDAYGWASAWLVQEYDNSPKGRETVLVASHGDSQGFRTDGTTPADAATRKTAEHGVITDVTIDEMESCPPDLPVAKREQLGERLEECGLCTIRSVPVEHDGITYGALTVVRATPIAEFESDLLEEFAGAIAFKYQHHRQQAALVSETVTELDIRIENGHFLAELSRAATIPADATIRAHGLQETGDGTVNYLLKTEGVDPRQVRKEATSIEVIRMASTTGVPSTVQLCVETPALGAVLSGYGGAVRNMRACDGILHVTIQCPRLTSVREMSDLIQEHWPGATIRSRHERTTENDHPAPFGGLTKKQEQAVRAATVAGFFDRPQAATASDVADILGVSRSTFLHHLRTAEQTVFTETFGDGSE